MKNLKIGLHCQYFPINLVEILQQLLWSSRIFGLFFNGRFYITDKFLNILFIFSKNWDSHHGIAEKPLWGMELQEKEKHKDQEHIYWEVD